MLGLSEVRSVERVFGSILTTGESMASCDGNCGCSGGGTFTEKEGHDAVQARLGGVQHGARDTSAIVGDMNSAVWW